MLFFNVDIWHHYFGGIIAFNAKYIATVYPSLFYRAGSCFHDYFGINPFLANINATVLPFLSLNN